MQMRYLKSHKAPQTHVRDFIWRKTFNYKITCKHLP